MTFLEKQPDVVVIRYTNYKGKTRNRSIYPLRIFFGSTEYHKTPQWLLEAVDLGKDAKRMFAIKDINEWGI